MGSMILWQLAQTGFARCSAIRSRIVRILPLRCAFSFSGGSHVTLPFTQAGGFTVQAWVRAQNRLLPASTGIISTGGPGQEATSAQLELDGAGNYQVNAGNGDLSLFVGPATDSFHHVAITFDGITISTFFDGQLVQSESWIGSPDPGIQALNVGIDRSGLLPFDGAVDELQLFNRALTSVEVTQTFLAGSSGLCKDHAPTAAANASPNPAEATGPTGATVLLDGTGSSDPDGDPLVYSWREETTTLGTGSTLSVFLPIATHVITLDVDDAHH